MGEQAIGENLAAARIDAVGELVAAAGEQPRLLHGAVELGLRRDEAAALRGDRCVLGYGAGRRGRAELRQAVGDLLETGLEHAGALAHLVAQGREALPQREKLFLGVRVLEALRDVVELGLEGLEVRLRRPLLRKRRGLGCRRLRRSHLGCRRLGRSRLGRRRLGCGRLRGHRLLRHCGCTGERQRKKRGAACQEGAAGEAAKHGRP